MLFTMLPHGHISLFHFILELKRGVLQQNKNISILISNVIVLKMVKITLRPYLEQVSNRENIRQV